MINRPSYREVFFWLFSLWKEVWRTQQKRLLFAVPFTVPSPTLSLTNPRINRVSSPRRAPRHGSHQEAPEMSSADTCPSAAHRRFSPLAWPGPGYKWTIAGAPTLRASASIPRLASGFGSIPSFRITSASDSFTRWSSLRFLFLFFSFLSIRVTLVDPLPSSNFSVVPFEEEEEFRDRGFGTLFPLLVSFPSWQNSVRLIPMNSFELNEVYRTSCPMLRYFLIRVSECFRLRQSFLWISWSIGLWVMMFV